MNVSSSLHLKDSVIFETSRYFKIYFLKNFNWRNNNFYVYIEFYN